MEQTFAGGVVVAPAETAVFVAEAGVVLADCGGQQSVAFDF